MDTFTYYKIASALKYVIQPASHDARRAHQTFKKCRETLICLIFTLVIVKLCGFYSSFTIYEDVF